MTGSPTGVDTGYHPAPSPSTLRSDASPLETSQVVNVVPAQVLRDQLPRNLDDALINISGITQGNTLAGTQDTIMKRGFGGNRDGSIMHNGMPVVQGRALNAASESVEVLKGPASLIYGIMDPGGVVNVITKQPQLAQHGSFSVIGSTFGRNKNGGEESIDITGPIGTNGLAYRMIVDQTNEAYWRNFGRRSETLIAPSLAWIGPSTKVVLSYEHREFLYPFDRGTALDPRTNTPLNIPATRRIDEPINNMWGNSDLIQLYADHTFAPDWKLHIGYSYDREAYDANQLRVSGLSAAGVETRSNDATKGALSVDHYGTAYVQGKAWLGGFRNDVLFGGDAEYRLIYRRDLLRQKPYYTGFNVYNPIYGREPLSSTVSASDSDQTDKLHDHSIFLQDTFYLTDKILIVGGVRYQGYDQLAGRGRPFTANTNLSGSKWLPLGGIIYRATDQVSFYGSYTQSLKPTSTIAPLITGVVIDSNVQPETAQSYEVGMKFDFADRLSGTLAFYNINKQNVLVTQYNDVTKLTDARTSGAARSRGIELDVAGKLTDQLSMIGSYAYTDALTTQDPLYAGLRLWNVARNTASLYLVYDFGQMFAEQSFGGKLRIGAGGHYVGKRAGDSANSFELPSYAVADTFATYATQIHDHPVLFQFNVKNLFNTVYYPSSVNKYFISMGDARRFSLAATVEF